jgi:hypothetical protein
MSQPCERLEGVEHAAVLRDTPIGDQRLELLTRVDGQGPPRRVLVRLLGKVALDQDTGCRVDELVGDRVL